MIFLKSFFGKTDLEKKSADDKNMISGNESIEKQYTVIDY